jgi:hypothetical protein
VKHVAILALLLGGCATNRVPPVKTVYVDRPVALECVPATLDGAPSYPDTDAALKQAVDAAERYALVSAGRLLRKARLAELEPVILSCRGGVSK